MRSKRGVSPVLLRIGLLAAIVLLIGWGRIAGVDIYFHAANLQTLLATLQELPPLVFVGAMALAPLLCLPILPLVMIAGILFGPWLGLVYSLGGACLGATFAFLLARYLAADWVQRRLAARNAAQLHLLVQTHGWKVVLVLRLLPVFPFAALNYCLGLTGIRLSHYCAATAIGIAPACAACVFFSDSLGQLQNGGAVVPVAVGAAVLLMLAGLGVLGKKTVLGRFYRDVRGKADADTGT